MTVPAAKGESSELQSLRERVSTLESEARGFAAMLYGIGDGVIATDAAGRVSLMNGAAEQLTGWLESEARGQPSTEVFHIVNEDTGAAVESPVTRVLREGRVVGLANHTLLVARDGTRRPIADSGAPVFDGKGGLFGTVLVFRDQSAERAHQQALESSERKFRDTVESLDDGYFRISADGTLLDHNPAFAGILGAEPGRNLRGTSTALVWDVRSLWETCLGHIEANGSAANLEAAAWRFDRTPVTLLLSAHLVREGGTSTLAGSMRDISERKRQELALRQSEAQYRMLFAANPSPMFIFDEETLGFLAVNEAALGSYGYSRNDFLALSVLDIRPPEDRALARTVIAQNRGRLETQIGTFRHCRKDGTVMEMEVTVSALDFAGRAARLCSMADVTLRRQTEQILRRHQLIVQQSRDALFFFRAADGQVVDANPAAAALYGYSHEELLRLTVSELRAPEACAGLAEQLVEAKTKGLLFESLHQRKDGSSFPVEVSSRGAVIGGEPMLISVIRDISERHSTRAQLEHVNAVLRGIRKVNQLIVNEQDPERLVERACATLVETRGYQGAWIIVDEPDRGSLPLWAGSWNQADARNAFQAALESDPRGWPPCRPAAKSARDGFVEVDVQTICVACPLWKEHVHGHTAVVSLRREGRHLGVLGVAFAPGVVVDVEERSLLLEVADDLALALADIELGQQRKRAEEERERLQSQLAQAQKMESVGRLAGGIAHDFNNMLGVINGHAELALERLEQVHPVRGDLRAILAAGTRSADLTRQLLAFARRQPRQPKIIDLNQVITGMLGILRRLIGENVELVCSTEPGLWKINADPTQLDQALANLAANARDAIVGVGRVSLETCNQTLDEKTCLDLPGARPGDYVRLSMTDTGVGMDEATLAHIFEPFFTTKEVGKGTGLGLATVYGVVQQNGGFLRVRSAPGRGTTFEIFFPRTTEAQSEVQASKGRGSRQGSETILVVEDEEPLLQLVSRILGRAGYRVLTANSPEQALQLDSRHDGFIDLLLTDVVMPGMSGHTLAERLRVRRPGLKCLYMSGYPAAARPDSGQVHLIQKPFSLKALEKAVRDALDGGEDAG